jgi:hypothetical protein
LRRHKPDNFFQWIAKNLKGNGYFNAEMTDDAKELWVLGQNRLIPFLVKTDDEFTTNESLSNQVKQQFCNFLWFHLPDELVISQKARWKSYLNYYYKRLEEMANGEAETKTLGLLLAPFSSAILGLEKNDEDLKPIKPDDIDMNYRPILIDHLLKGLFGLNGNNYSPISPNMDWKNQQSSNGLLFRLSEVKPHQTIQNWLALLTIKVTNTVGVNPRITAIFGHACLIYASIKHKHQDWKMKEWEVNTPAAHSLGCFDSSYISQFIALLEDQDLETELKRFLDLGRATIISFTEIWKHVNEIGCNGWKTLEISLLDFWSGIYELSNFISKFYKSVILLPNGNEKDLWLNFWKENEPIAYSGIENLCSETGECAKVLCQILI